MTKAFFSTSMRTVLLYATLALTWHFAAHAQPVPMPRAMPGDATCLIEPSADVQLGTPVDGVLEIQNMDRGMFVTVGQLLARLNTGIEASSVETQAAKAEFGKRKLLRNMELETKQLISPQELDEIATEQKLAELELVERQERLKLRNIVSPINGVVVDVFRLKGDLVRQEKIARLAQIDPLFVETVLPARRFGQIKLGNTHDVAPELGGGRVKATVINVDKVIDAASGTFRVRLSLPNPKFSIPPGQRCQILF